jgi:co-chaperonin GroES (HSP10)
MSVIIKALTPTGSRLLVKPVKQEATTKSGILVSTLEDRNPPMGTVLAIGPDVKIAVDDMGSSRYLQVGDVVIYERHTAQAYYQDVVDNDSRIDVISAQYVMMAVAKQD